MGGTRNHPGSARRSGQCLADGPASPRHIARQPSDRATTLFRIRLSLAAVDLAAGTHPDQAEFMHIDLVEEAEQSSDAFAAREVLRHPGCHARMTPEQTRALTTLVQQAGLSAGSIPESLLDDLMVSVQLAETVLAQTLRVARSDRSQIRLNRHRRPAP